MSDDLNFGNLDPVQITFSVGSRTFLLREATSADYCTYQDAIASAAIYNEAGKRVGYKNLTDVEPLLVSRCVVEITADKGHIAISLEEVRAWPARIISKLYDKVLKISEINQVEDEKELLKQKEEIEKRLKLLKKGSEAKNEQGG